MYYKDKMPKIHVLLLLKIEVYTILVFPRPNSKFVHPHYLVKIPNAKSVHVNHVFGAGTWYLSFSPQQLPIRGHGFIPVNPLLIVMGIGYENSKPDK